MRTTIDLTDTTGVELRVHGVGGAPPDALLDDPHPVQVAGDRIAGFYRGPDVDGHHTEGYSWGGLTSRSAARVLWLLLTPFALVNMAGWMHEKPVSAGYRLLVRTIALTVTLGYVTWACVAAMDVLALQCGGQPACTAGRWWLAPISSPGMIANPGRRLLVGVLVPLGILVLLGVLSERSRRRYEVATDPDRTVTRSEEHGLADPGFWRGQQMVRRLGDLHLVGGVAVIAIVLALAADGLGSTGFTAQVAAVTGTAVLLGALIGLAPAEGAGRQLRLALSALAILAAAFAMAAAVEVPAVQATPGGPGTLTAIQTWTSVLSLARAVLLLVLGALTLRRIRQGPRFRFGGPFAVATLGAVLLDMIGNGVALSLADLAGERVLDGLQLVRASDVVQIVVPRVRLAYAGSVLAVLMLMILCLAIGVAWSWRQGTAQRRAADDAALTHGCAEPAVVSGAGPPIPLHLDPRWRRAVARLTFLSRGTDHVDRLIGATMWFSVLSGLVGATLVLSGADLPILRLPSGYLTAAARSMALLPLAAIVLLRMAWTDHATRRIVGILWDVGTFWPRGYHPLAPPSYAERAVPELTQRLRVLLATGAPVVLSGHSQGSVLGVAAVLQLPPGHRSLAMVTHGAPVRRLYARFFPSWFDATTLAGAVESRLQPAADGGPRPWSNAWRGTDPIGGPVFGDPPDGGPGDLLIPDPPTCWALEYEEPPRVIGHSDYDKSPEVRGLVTALLARTRPAERVKEPSPGSALR